MKTTYTVMVRETHYDEWEPHIVRTPEIPRNGEKQTERENTFTNKRAGAAEVRRLVKLQDAANGLRKIEGSKERHHREYKLIDNNGETVYSMLDMRR